MYIPVIFGWQMFLIDSFAHVKKSKEKKIYHLVHNVPNVQMHFKNLAVFAAVLKVCLAIFGCYALKG